MDIQEMETDRRRGREFAEELAQRDRAEQVQWQYDRIRGGSYNVRYTEINDNQRANYLNGDYRERDQRAGKQVLERKKRRQYADYVMGLERRWVTCYKTIRSVRSRKETIQR